MTDDDGRAAATVDAQEGLFDQQIDDDALADLLEERETRKTKRLNANRSFKEKDDQVKARLSEFDLKPGEVARCGRFKIKTSRVAGRSVSFETGGSDRMTISLLDDAP